MFTPAEASRRRALCYFIALPAASGMSGCWWLRPKPPGVICPESPNYSYLSGKLTMDTHCHVFNGTDLQVKEFVSRVFVNEGGLLGVVARAMGALLQDLAWSYAPTGKDELAELARIENEMRTCTTVKAISGTVSKLK